MVARSDSTLVLTHDGLGMSLGKPLLTLGDLNYQRRNNSLMCTLGEPQRLKGLEDEHFCKANVAKVKIR